MVGKLTPETFADIADHTLLAPETTRQELDEFLADAVLLGVKRVCISPSLLPVDKRGLEIVTVVGFPSGAHQKEVKAFEASKAVSDGADEIDMVINRSLVKSGDYAGLEDEIVAVRKACPGRVLKVILESSTLSLDEIKRASQAAKAAGADMVKTSTGFHPSGGATLEAVKAMREAVGNEMGVKASGGVRAAEDAEAYYAAGATRFGVSGTAAILAQLRGEKGFGDASRGY